jgi:hypothetical protein
VTAARTALHRVCEGYVEPAERTWEAADALWCRLAAQGRIVGRADDGCRDVHLRVHLTLIEHPDLPAGQVYAAFGMGQGTLSVYRCLPEDAREALRDPSAFNL